MVYLIKVGKRSRSGNFQEYCSKAISVDDGVEQRKVYRYFQNCYKGLEISIDRVNVQEFSEQIKPAPKVIAEKRDSHYGRLCNFDVVLTESEKQKVEELRQCRNKQGELEGEIIRSVKNRYRELSYVQNYRDIELSVESYKVVCTSLPINSDSFFKVVKLRGRKINRRRAAERR